jgi:hypothetical protein
MRAILFTLLFCYRGFGPGCGQGSGEQNDTGPSDSGTKLTRNSAGMEARSEVRALRERIGFGVVQ